MEEASAGDPIKENVKPYGECTSFGYRTFAVVDQTDDYYIVKNEKGEPLVFEKDKCRVEVIGVSMIR